MIISKNIDNGKATLALDGWLDTESATLLGEELEKLTDYTLLVFDFEKLEYISSSGLRQVTAAYKQAKALNAEFQIVNVCNEVMDVFKLTGLDKKFNIV